MAKYNLIRNGYFRSLTSSGTGNVSLTWPQLELLQDGNLTSSGISITVSDVLYLEVDLSQRIKIDGIRLYANDLTKSSYIDFYYKNESGDNFTHLTTQVGSYYYSSVDSPSAPRYIRVTVSGIDVDLYEFQVFNDDYIVEFGQDGSQYAEYLDDTPIGEEGASQAIAIYNNTSTANPAVAYAVIDYTGNIADEYVKISSLANGTYYGINDSALLESNDISETYRWDMGTFDGTEVSADKVIATGASGVYTTPIFKLLDKYMSSYFLINGNTTSGVSSISYDPDTYNGTIRVRSSETTPINHELVYVAYGNDNIQSWIPYNNDEEVDWKNLGLDGYYSIIGCIANKQNGDIALSLIRGYSHWSRLYILDKDANVLRDSSPVAGYHLVFNIFLDFDVVGGLWGYGSGSYAENMLRLYHYRYDLGALLATIDGGGSDFLSDGSAEVSGDGCWYCDQVYNILVHVSSDGTTLQEISLNSPRWVCSNSDNGCWVSDIVEYKIYKYSSTGVLLKTVDISELNPGYYAKYLTNDRYDGCWFVCGSEAFHITSNGVADIGPVSVNDPEQLRGAHNGVYIISTGYNKVTYIDKSTGTITKQWFYPQTSSESRLFGVASFSYDDMIEFSNTDQIIPVSYDPVWGTGGSLNWQEVRKDGYFLPKDLYHQVEVTLRGPAELEGILMPPAVKIQDIQPQSYKNMYIKTDIPSGASITDYETRLKVWWGEEE